MLKDAIISLCGKYRYLLDRNWSEDQPEKSLGFIMLNPSKANAEVDDPTIRRCVGYAEAWGYNRLLVGNLYLFRATKQEELKEAPDRFSIQSNEYHLQKLFNESDRVIAAWGCEQTVFDLEEKSKDRSPLTFIHALTKSTAKPLHCLALTKKGTPRHPSRLNAALKPKLWDMQPWLSNNF